MSHYKLLFVSLGCAKNLVDSEQMLEVLADYGFTFTDDPSDADAAFINTCTFIDEAKSESIENIIEIAQYKKPDKGRLKALVVGGCLTERYRESLYDDIPEIDAIIGLSNIRDVASVVLWALQGNSKLMMGDIPMVRVVKPKGVISVENYIENSPDVKRPRISLTPPFWSYLKVADGCNNPCSFCVIPQIRGKYKSVPADVLVAKARRLAEDGVREINIIAQDTSNYGRDLYGETRLHELVENISKIDGIRWVRVLYTYPLHVSEALIRVMAENHKVCKYIDVPLQHVSDNVLKLMNRGMTYEKTEKFIENLREKIPGVCIRTSFIIGHPGETEEDVEALAAFLRKHKLEKAGFFRYSQEDGTPAASLPDQVPEKEKTKRLKFISKEYDKILKEINESMIGRELEAIVEDHDEKKRFFMARSYREAPEVDGMIKVDAKKLKHIAPGDFIKIKITGHKKYELVAEAI